MTALVSWCPRFEGINHPVTAVRTSTLVSASGKKPDSALHRAVLLSFTNLGPKTDFVAAQSFCKALT
jgi:hypothetical protein